MTALSRASGSSPSWPSALGFIVTIVMLRLNSTSNSNRKNFNSNNRTSNSSTTKNNSTNDNKKSIGDDNKSSLNFGPQSESLQNLAMVVWRHVFYLAACKP